MFIGIAGGQIGATGSAGPPINLLVAGDSWMDGLESALNASVPNLRQDNIATSGETLYGANQIMADLTARLASPSFTYNTAVIEGGANDWLAAPTVFTLAQWKSAYVTMIDQCIAAGIPNVCAVSAVVIGDVWNDNDSNVWDLMVDANPSIPAIWAEFDTWLEAYCEAVGAKFINMNQLPFAQNQIPEAGMTSAAHPDASGNLTLAEYIFKPVLQAPTPVVTQAVTVTRARPKKSLLTVADMSRITQVVTDLSSEWSKATEVWLLDQTDITASGNALTGLKGTVLLPKTGAPGTADATITRDATSGAEGVILESGEFLRTGITPASIGRTLSMLTVKTAQSSYGATFIWAGSIVGFSDHQVVLSAISNTSMTGRGSSVTANYAESSTNPSTLLGSCVELRTVESGANQLVTIYESGSIIDNGTTNNILKTYSGSATGEIVIHGSSLSGFGFSGATETSTFRAFALTNGTHTASLWAAALEA
jgi:hypothetical protein